MLIVIYIEIRHCNTTLEPYLYHSNMTDHNNFKVANVSLVLSCTCRCLVVGHV